MRLFPACVVPAVAFAVAAFPLPAQGKLDLELLLEWESVSDPRLSPDGRQIVYTRQWTDKVEDRMRSELWLMGRDGSRQRHLVAGSSAQWSPDGTRLCYLAEGAPKGTQLWVVWLDTREATQLTHVTEPLANPRWSPDGTQIAFDMQVPEQDGFKIAMPKAPKGAKWAEEPTVITRLDFRRDRQGYRPSGYRHLFVVAATGGTPRQITKGDFDHNNAEWTADGKELVFSGKLTEDADWLVRESEVHAVAIAGSAVRKLTERAGPDHSPKPSPDGHWIAWLSGEKNETSYDISPLWLMASDGSGKRPLTAELDRQPQNLQWAPDCSAVWFTIEDQGDVVLCRCTLDGKVERLSAHGQVFALGSVGGDGRYVGTSTTATDPGSVVCGTRGEPAQPLTAVHDDLMHGRTLGRHEELWWDGPDGFRVQGWLVKPPDFDAQQRYPLILKIHGGPHAAFNCAFNFENQNHAANGYLVLYCNPRGSTGYGAKFGNAIQNDYPNKDYEDLIAGVDAVIAQGSVDVENLFVYGGSGGGVLTCWTIGMTQRFRAAVSMFPVTNWISFVGTTDGPYWYTNFQKHPWEDITEHWRRSPLRLVGNVTTPTMMICGELDLRTPIGQTEEYYQALKLRKVDTVLVRVPGEYHGAAGRHVSNMLRRILYVRTWFDKHKKAAAGAIESGLDK